MKYRILDAFSPIELSDRVDDYLNNGWDLYGNMTMAIWSDRVIFCQTMTRNTENETAKELND
jgi:hypothetical protein